MAGCDTPSSLCYCPARQAVHVHCFCGVCKGKAVNYRTQISHLKSSAFYDIERTEEQLAENEHELEANTDRDPIEGKLLSGCKNREHFDLILTCPLCSY